MIFVGQDLHVRNSMFYATDAEGRMLMQRRCANRPAEMAGFWETLLRKVGGEIQPVRVVLEATTNARAGQRLTVTSFADPSNTYTMSVSSLLTGNVGYLCPPPALDQCQPGSGAPTPLPYVCAVSMLFPSACCGISCLPGLSIRLDAVQDQRM